MFKNLKGAMDKAKEAIHKATGPADEPAAAKEEEAAAAAPAEAEAEEEKYDGPPRLGEEEANKRAAAIREAIEGAGTDEDALVANLCDLPYNQVVEVNEAYTALGHNLLEDIENDTSGKFERVLVGLLTSPGDACADTCRKAMKGMGTDEKLLTEAICLSSDQTLRDAVVAYRTRHDRLLIDDVESEADGTLKLVLAAVLRAAVADNYTEATEEELETDVVRLYKAGEDKIGTNEGVFVDVFCSKGEKHRDAVAKAYAKKYGKSLVKVVKDEFGGDAERALLYLLRNTAETFAHILHDAMAGMGSDEATMIRVIVQQRHQLADINQKFLDNWEKSVARWVESEVSGDTKAALVAICKNFE